VRQCSIASIARRRAPDSEAPCWSRKAGPKRRNTSATSLPIPALEAATRAPWPVWAGSIANPVRFAPLAKKAAVRLWHRARDFDRGTHQAGRHSGAVGPTALQVLHTLIFDFLNHRTGRLDPSYAAIAAKAGVCVRTVATALKRLRELGILNWVRRCAERWAGGRFVLEQETNAYGLLPESQWRGYRPPPEPPEPEWGQAPIMPSALAQAALETDRLVRFTGVHEMRRNMPQT
jgi:helix-turn-helix protein